MLYFIACNLDETQADNWIYYYRFFKKHCQAHAATSSKSSFWLETVSKPNNNVHESLSHIHFVLCKVEDQLNELTFFSSTSD